MGVPDLLDVINDLRSDGIRNNDFGKVDIANTLQTALDNNKVDFLIIKTKISKSGDQITGIGKTLVQRARNR